MVTEYLGTCDASAAEAVGDGLFVVASDEDNILRVYRRDAGGMPLATFDLTAHLDPDPDHPEADIEAAARVGDRIYWITSHGRNREGKFRPNRRRFFATDIVPTEGGGISITPVGTQYRDLLTDLVAAPDLAAFDLRAAEKRAPEASGGLNIEGLAAAPDGRLLIAFRNPIPHGKALIVPLMNHGELIAGGPAVFGSLVTVALGGRGVRSIAYFAPQDRYLIAAGAPDDASDFALYGWAGPGAAAIGPIAGIDFAGTRPEALVVYPGERQRVQLLSDDGGKAVGGQECKKAPPDRRSFRGIWVTP